MNIVLTKNRIRRATEQLREEVMPNDRAIDQPTDRIASGFLIKRTSLDQKPGRNSVGRSVDKSIFL